MECAYDTICGAQAHSLALLFGADATNSCCNSHKAEIPARRMAFEPEATNIWWSAGMSLPVKSEAICESPALSSVPAGLREISEATLSIVIPNYNYARYVGTAIRSALEVRWPKVEVIVVDDGSTDDSWAIIQSFANEATIVRQPNAGQVASCINGFRRSSGDFVIFLDSDDRLHPDVMTEIAAVWSPNACKYQFQMRVIDAAGNPTGGVLPQYYKCPKPEDIRAWVKGAASYPTPPGSGNAYTRSFVEYVFGFKTGFVDRAPDSYLLAAAPAFGDIITIPKPIVDYRVHGENYAANLRLDETRPGRELSLAQRRRAYFLEVARAVGIDANPEALERNLIFTCLRASSYALRPDLHPIQADSAAKILRSALKAGRCPQGFSPSQSWALVVWIVFVALGPRALQRSLVTWRYAPSQRPDWIRRLTRALRITR
ncbi:glycosyltransferase family 2 protein [Bradyrhizobium sp. LHD-71]|uniref:glycosyltransferase family 2 protein n=1 Tax=Bradyrhizobium sp. LHD-71 TaxID=3072141 RepID=UPI00280CF2FB|nr:glycosyltransferase family 2 protein [Bradyrhizobium sp. LHD-71]MDQ8727642.1 glycosyltransferase family 2 protein [Bradyrhizobium sp. LHD-71]